MMTHLLIFRAAMVRQIRDLPDAFRARPRDFVRIAEPGSGGLGPNEGRAAELRHSLAVALLTGCHPPAGCRSGDPMNRSSLGVRLVLSLRPAAPGREPRSPTRSPPPARPWSRPSTRKARRSTSARPMRPASSSGSSASRSRRCSSTARPSVGTTPVRIGSWWTAVPCRQGRRARARRNRERHPAAEARRDVAARDRSSSRVSRRSKGSTPGAASARVRVSRPATFLSVPYSADYAFYRKRAEPAAIHGSELILAASAIFSPAPFCCAAREPATSAIARPRRKIFRSADLDDLRRLSA